MAWVERFNGHIADALKATGSTHWREYGTDLAALCEPVQPAVAGVSAQEQDTDADHGKLGGFKSEMQHLMNYRGECVEDCWRS